MATVSPVVRGEPALGRLRRKRVEVYDPGRETTSGDEPLFLGLLVLQKKWMLTSLLTLVHRK